MNYAQRTVAQNASHRMDQVTGAWTASGRGSARVHENYQGYQLRKAPDGHRWLVLRPSGEVVNPYPPLAASVHSLTEAKHRAEEDMANRTA